MRVHHLQVGTELLSMIEKLQLSALLMGRPHVCSLGLRSLRMGMQTRDVYELDELGWLILSM